MRGMGNQTKMIFYQFCNLKNPFPVLPVFPTKAPFLPEIQSYLLHFKTNYRAFK